MELLIFYKISFFVAALSGGVLSHIGKHCFLRGNILEIFFLSQLSLMGNLISKLLFHSKENDLNGIFLSYLFYAIGKFILYKKEKFYVQGSFMIGGYLSLLALQYLIIGFFPQLDSHMSLGFFGNMVTASSFENFLLIVVLCVFTILYSLKQKDINKNSLEINILNAKDISKFEFMLFFIPLVTCLYGLGFLYTMSFLLLPSLILADQFSSEKKATLALILVSVISSVLGLFLSIVFERISTTSVQIFLLVIIAGLFRVFQNNKKNYIFKA